MYALCYFVVEMREIKQILKAGNWVYNSNYWTSGRRIHNDNTFQWCRFNQSAFFTKHTPIWITQSDYPEPDNKAKKENCAHFYKPKESWWTGMTDRDCANKFLFSCKVHFSFKSSLLSYFNKILGFNHSSSEMRVSFVPEHCLREKRLLQKERITQFSHFNLHSGGAF
jgi:hypothetical protein